VACPFGRLVFTTFPLLPTPILSDPFGIWGVALTTRTEQQGASTPAVNSLYQGETPMLGNGPFGHPLHARM